MMRSPQAGTVWRMASTRVPTWWGMFESRGFERDVADGSQQVDATIPGDPTQGASLLSIHSWCFTGEVLGSLCCDCSDRLAMAMRVIALGQHQGTLYAYLAGHFAN